MSSPSKKYQEILNILEDQYLLTLSMIREKNDDGTRYSFEELLTKDGLCLDDIDSMEDVEIE